MRKTIVTLVSENPGLQHVNFGHNVSDSNLGLAWAIFLGDPAKVYNKGGSADNAAVEDVELLGAWNGIAAVQAHRHYIARVQGTVACVMLATADSTRSRSP